MRDLIEYFYFFVSVKSGWNDNLLCNVKMTAKCRLTDAIQCGLREAKGGLVLWRMTRTMSVVLYSVDVTDMKSSSHGRLDLLHLGSFLYVHTRPFDIVTLYTILSCLTRILTYRNTFIVVITSETLYIWIYYIIITRLCITCLMLGSFFTSFAQFPFGYYFTLSDRIWGVVRGMVIKCFLTILIRVL